MSLSEDGKEIAISEQLKSYKRSLTPHKLALDNDFVIEMILNNMKIEGQEISKDIFIKFLKEHESNTSK
jgi:hypothetical protein